MEDSDWRRFCEQARKAAADGKFGYAETSWIAALQEVEDYGDSDERLIETLEGLSETYWNQGKFRHAEKPALQVLAICQKRKPNDHIEVGMAAYRLATVYHMQQKYGQAEPLYKQALTINTKQLGNQHPDLIPLLENYADLLMNTHRQAEADNLLNCAKAATNQLSVANQPRTTEEIARPQSVAPAAPPSETSIVFEQKSWEALRDTAEAHIAAGRKVEGLEIWNQAINLAERFSSQEKLAMSLDRAGEILFQTEKYGQAEMFWWRSLQIKLAALGQFHAAVALTANNLASLHYLMGRYAEAESYSKKCLEIYKVVSGADHPNVAVCLHNLGSLYHVQGRYAEAEDQYRKALDIRRKVLGTDHRETIAVGKNLATLLKTLGRDSEADELNALAGNLITGSWKALDIDPEQMLTSARDE